MYKKILVPIDGSATATRGLTEALGLARDVKADLCLLYVADQFPMMFEFSGMSAYNDLRNALHERGNQALDQAKAAADAQGVHTESVFKEVVNQPVGTVIVDEAIRLGCDLIVMGTHGRRGMSHLVLGSDAEAVLKSTPVPVLLVRAPGTAS
ncbi:MAG: universal stress protein [Burkholderiales bacterium]|nr:universal stress protein [Burkholderiales bacterium]